MSSGTITIIGDSSTPLGIAIAHVAQLLSTSSNVIDWESVLPHLYTIMSCISDDSSYNTTELGRLGAIPSLLSIATYPIVGSISQSQHKAQMTSWVILSSACSHTSFYQRFLVPILTDPSCSSSSSSSSSLSVLKNLVPSIKHILSTAMEEDDGDMVQNWMIASMGFLLRFILQLYQDDKKFDIQWINPCPLCSPILSSPTQNRLRLSLAFLDLLLTWTAPDIDRVIESSRALDPFNDSSTHTRHDKNTLTKQQMQSMKPRDIAAYNQKLYLWKEDAKQRSKTNIIHFCDCGGLSTLISCAAQTPIRTLEQTCITTLSRLFTCLFDEWETVFVPFLQPILSMTPTIGFECVDDETKGDDNPPVFFTLIQKGILIIAMLQCSPDMGAWALSHHGGSDLLNHFEEFFSQSNHIKAQRIASQILSSAASIEKGRTCISSIVRSGTIQSLLQSTNEDVASNIASTFAKLGLADTKTCSDEGEILSLLEVGTQLLFHPYHDTMSNSSETKKGMDEMEKCSSSSTSIQRGIEILSYVSTKTFAKDELAHGYKGTSSSSSSQTVMDRFVELCIKNICMGNTVEAYGIASIFSSLVVSNETLRTEAFQGKEITMEQYEHLQNLGRTEEEKEWEKTHKDVDPPQAVQERIRQLVHKNVPRAIIALLEYATDNTQDLLLSCLVRMAGEESVRGMMIQQGVLSTCLAVVSENHQGTEAGKKRVRFAQHCVAKLLVTTNPTLLTSSQRIGSIKPLIHLVKDNDSTDLQQFESLLSLTNLASVDDETKNKIVKEKGVSVFHLAMFSDHPMVRRAATEAMSNLFPHPDMLAHLRDPSHMRLWVAFSIEFDVNMECSRAATGCLAMASSDYEVAMTLSKADHFEEMVRNLLSCGNLEIMHRLLVLLMNLTSHGSDFRECVEKSGAYAFLERYIYSYHLGDANLGMSKVEMSQLMTTVQLAKELIKSNR